MKRYQVLENEQEKIFLIKNFVWLLYDKLTSELFLINSFSKRNLPNIPYPAQEVSWISFYSISEQENFTIYFHKNTFYHIFRHRLFETYVIHHKCYLELRRWLIDIHIHKNNKQDVTTYV